MSVALANYAASGLGERTACLELGGHGEWTHWKAVNQKGYFTDAKIDYYPCLTEDKIPTLLNCGYEKLIMDFGDEYKKYYGELLRCDRKIILLNLNPWQEFAARKIVQAVQNGQWGNAMPVYASVHAQESVKRALEKELKISVIKLPAIPDPMHILPEEFPCMDFILGRGAMNYKRRKTRFPVFRKI